mmetsp:Transcript_43494/g.128700  ORF Transcript_43494/g.128700 Transcript_43494/m.128700 type:complete len:263 (+) Transcript_43494:634-1422(+)
MPERHLELRRREVQGIEARHQEVGDRGGPPRSLEDGRQHEGGPDRVEHQQAGDELRVGEGEAGVLDLRGVEQVHEAAGERLVDAGEDRGRDLEHAVVQALRDQDLDHVEEHLDPVELVLLLALVEVEEGLGVQAADVQDLEAVGLAVLDLLQGAAVAEAHEAHEGMPELRDLLRLRGERAAREGHEAAHRVEPLPPHLVQQARALPEAAHGLRRAEGEQDAYRHGGRRVALAGTQLLRGRVMAPLRFPSVQPPEKNGDDRSG